MSIRNYLLLFLIFLGSQTYAQQHINGFSMPESVASNGKRFFLFPIKVRMYLVRTEMVLLVKFLPMGN